MFSQEQTKKKNTYEAEKDSENSSGLLFNSSLEKKTHFC